MSAKVHFQALLSSNAVIRENVALLLVKLARCVNIVAGCSDGSPTATGLVDPGPVPDPRLLSSLWVVTKATTSSNDPIQPVTQLIADGAPAKIDFDANLFYRIDDGGCLIFESAYIFSTSDLRHDPSRRGRPTTGVQCPDSFIRVYELLFALLDLGASWTISDSTLPPKLTLVSTDGSVYEFMGASR